MNKKLIDWLMEGDPSIQKLTSKYLLKEKGSMYEKAQLEEGWGHEYLSKRHPKGYWGRGFYAPKWTCSHYTLLELRNLEMPITDEIQESIHQIITEYTIADGGVYPTKSAQHGDNCIDGMFLNYASYFEIEEKLLTRLVDLLLASQLADGGYNCRIYKSGAHHSSVHTTICVLEGFATYLRKGYTYRLEEMCQQKQEAEEFLLSHHLYKSDKTGEVIHPNMTVMAYPSRYKYNFMRALYYFAKDGHPYDVRMEDAITLLKKKRNKDGSWSMQSKHPGEQHFIMEKGGKPSRMNTYMAMVILNAYDQHK